MGNVNMMNACRHNKVWVMTMHPAIETPDGILVRETYLWCYECGALRSTDSKKWVSPVGRGGKNPALSDPPPPPPVDNDHVAEGCEQFSR